MSKTEVSLHIKQPSLISRAGSHLYAGFFGGLTSAVLLQPFDLLKTRIQQSPSSKSAGLIANIKSLGVTSTGTRNIPKAITELWRGTLPSAIRTSTGSALYLTSLNSIRTYLAGLDSSSNNSNNRRSSSLPKLSMQANLLTGAFARTAVGFLTMPITVVKVRYESSLYRYRSMLEAIQSISRQEGLKGFFTGFGATCLRDAPYAGLYVLFYEQLKNTIPALLHMNSNKSNNDYFNISTSASINTTSAMLAAILSTTITGPFDTIKTRMQLEPSRYKTFLSSIKIIIQNENTSTSSKKYNFKNLFDGLSLRLMRKGASSGIAWCIYEELVK